MEIVTDFNLGGPKITAGSDCRCEIKRYLLLGRKAVTNLDNMLKSKHHFADKGPSSQALVFSSIMYRCESWTIRKSDWQRIDAFELWCWRKLSQVPWTARRSSQSIVKEINPEYSWEGLTLKLQYFGHLMQRAGSLRKTLMMGKTDGRRRRGRQRMRWLDGITDSMDVSQWTPGAGDGQGGLACCDSWGCKGSDTTEWLNWTECYYRGYFLQNFQLGINKNKQIIAE